MMKKKSATEGTFYLIYNKINQYFESNLQYGLCN